MARNFLLEAQMKEAATLAGCLESALPDFELDVQTFKVTAASEIPAYVEKCKTEKPHRFAVQNNDDAELCQRAFIFKNMTAQSQLYRAVGEKRFNELKALYANGLPESEKKRLNGSADHSKNPWAATEANINPKTGRFSDDAIHRQMSLVRATGPEKSAQIAASVGSKLGDLYAAGFKRVA
jgi:hypothetical protein